jgi:predicted anti-sigma-YlaC factor YlaD
MSLIPQTTGWLRLLRFGLLLSSIGWGISFLFTFSSWDSASDKLYLMGAGYVGYRPLLDYWLKMASATFGCIGIASALACYRPTLFESLVWLLGPFHAFIGVVLLVSAISNNLNTDRHTTFVADITFCFLTAILISLPLLAGLIRKLRQTTPQDGND